MKKNQLLLISLILTTILLTSCNFTSKKENENNMNLFNQAGISQEEVDKKVEDVYKFLFESEERIYFEINDSMAYVSDLKNLDVRTEGVSYGMMVAVQLDKKDVFDKIWRWTKEYMQHKEGPRKGYFGWSLDPTTMKLNSMGSASDGELFFVTTLLFASNKWGNDTGINYYAEARFILDSMWEKDGSERVFNIINVDEKKITFVPEGFGYYWTDPSYHVPAFFDIWALYANDGHKDFYKEVADSARIFLHRACHPLTGLTSDYTEYSGEPKSTQWMPEGFHYDSWRVPLNIAMDYTWFGKDKEWQESYAKKIQAFFRSQGIDTFNDQYNLDGTTPEIVFGAGADRVTKLRHSIGLKSTLATTALVSNEDNESLDFVKALWNAKLEPYEDGYFDPYYDGLLYLFSLMMLNNQYQHIAPAN